MKSIPAIDEAGEFLSVRLNHAAENRVFYLLTLCDDFAVILEDDGISFRVRLDDIIDLPAVRDRVERARMKREYEAGRTHPMPPLNDSQRPKRPSFSKKMRRTIRSAYEEMAAGRVVDWEEYLVQELRASEGERALIRDALVASYTLGGKDTYQMIKNVRKSAVKKKARTARADR